jgi:hypothetical protein
LAEDNTPTEAVGVVCTVVGAHDTPKKIAGQFRDNL